MSSLSVALSALQAQQQSMLVTSQNIANAGTEGYSTQRTVLTSNALKTTGSSLYGGVQAGSIENARDRALDGRIYDATSLQSRLSTTSSINTDLESLLGSVDGTNLQTQMADVASAFNDMAANPDDEAIATAAVESLDTLASLLNQIADGVASIAGSVTDQAITAVEDINQAMSELAALNLSIQRSGYAGGTSNEYADQQSLLLEKLAGYMQIDASYAANGTVSVTCDGAMLVAGSATQPLELTGSASAGIHLVLAGSGIRLDPVSGSMSAFEQAVNQDLPGYLTQLDGIALGLIDYLGTLQSIGSDGSAGTEMVSASTFSSAQLTQDIDKLEYDAVHALGVPAGLGADLPDTGSCTVMCLNAYDSSSGLASTYVLTYDAGSGVTPASRSLQDLVDAINSGSGGGFSLVPPASGLVGASLVASSGGYKLVISSSDGRTLDCGTAIDSRPTDSASASAWTAGDAGFALSGSYDGGAPYDPAMAMTVTVTGGGTIGDDSDPPTVQVSIPVEVNGTVSMVTTSYTLDSTLPAGVPIDLGYGLEITFDSGVMTASGSQLSVITDASDDRTGLLGAIGLDRILVGTGARDIRVADEIAASPGRIATGSARAEGASDIASAMAELVTKADIPGGSGTAVGTAYQQLVSDVGQSVANAGSMGEVQTLVLTTLENQRQILIGVDVDEQMALLIEQQQAYSAAARVVSMVRDNNTTLLSILD